MRFNKFIIYFTKKAYTEKIRDFIRTEKDRSGVMTSTRIQPFCKKHYINIGCFDGKRINPRNTTEGNISSFLYKNLLYF